jgi:hypothetical protein
MIHSSQESAGSYQLWSLKGIFNHNISFSLIDVTAFEGKKESFEAHFKI